jgi:hypothetical protein
LDVDLVEVYFPQNSGICSPDPAWKTPYQQRSWPHLGANVVVAMTGRPYSLWMVPALAPIQSGHDNGEPPKYPSPKVEKYLCVYVKDAYSNRNDLIALLKRHGAISPQEYKAQLGAAYETFE